MNFLDMPSNTFEVVQSSTPAGLATGQVIRFDYSGQTKNALVLVGDWKGKLHALSLNEMSEASLKALLKELAENTSDALGLRNKYESSSYTKTKSYRTYSPEKISSVKIVRLAEKKKNV